MKEIHKERLLQLADFLETLPPERFDYGTFGFESPKCGTVACAFGWAPGVFPDLISWTEKESVCCPGNFHFGFRVKRGDAWVETHEEDAGRTLFGLDGEQFDYLFLPDCGDNYLSDDASAKEVAAHIRSFVANDGDLPGL